MMLSPELQAVGLLSEAAKYANQEQPAQAIDKAQEAIRVLLPLAAAIDATEWKATE